MPDESEAEKGAMGTCGNHWLAYSGCGRAAGTEGRNAATHPARAPGTGTRAGIGIGSLLYFPMMKNEI
jgi:hypothetical protein